MKECSKCKRTKELSEFYPSKTHSQGVMTYCKNCFNTKCQERWIKRKLYAIEHKGNQCEDCKIHIIDSHYSIFEFHHLNPQEKDYDWNKLRLKPWSTIINEINKCALLCANCHRLRHARN